MRIDKFNTAVIYHFSFLLFHRQCLTLSSIVPGSRIICWKATVEKIARSLQTKRTEHNRIRSRNIYTRICVLPEKIIDQRLYMYTVVTYEYIETIETKHSILLAGLVMQTTVELSKLFFKLLSLLLSHKGVSNGNWKRDFGGGLSVISWRSTTHNTEEGSLEIARTFCPLPLLLILLILLFPPQRKFLFYLADRENERTIYE